MHVRKIIILALVCCLLALLVVVILWFFNSDQSTGLVRNENERIDLQPVEEFSNEPIDPEVDREAYVEQQNIVLETVSEEISENDVEEYRERQQNVLDSL